MNVALVFLITYTVALTAFGVWVGRRVTGAADFFVAGRSLSWPLIAGTVLAANIGAGTTVGAAGLAYRDGLGALWWNGAVGIGTLVLALWVGPKLWQLASDRGHFTVGDFLEERYGGAVRGLVGLLIAVGALALLAGQLIAGAAVLEVVGGLPRWQGIAIGGIAMTVYFTAGGLLSSAWVNALQLVVLLGGFLVAAPLILMKVGGLEGIAATPGIPATFWDPLYSAGVSSGWTLLILLTPGFIISPGLVQKAYGAIDARSVRIGLGVAAGAQMLFSFLPVVLGMAARVNHPDIASANVVLPTVLLAELPVAIGALSLAAIFTAEVSTCDAILFMVATSSSRDLYQRFINPKATSAQMLFVARAAALIGGVLGMLLATQLATIIDALKIFYSLLSATLFVPMIGALLSTRAGAREAMAAIVCGVTALLTVQFGTDRTGWWDPSLWGLMASAVGYVGMLMTRSASRAA